jgi:CDGSH-type Zn-finger protein
MRFVNAEGMEHPMVTRLEPGTYSFCMCGRTKTPPYCDGSHSGSAYSPLEFVADEAKDVSLCTCGLTHNPPFCDGSHKDY